MRSNAPQTPAVAHLHLLLDPVHGGVPEEQSDLVRLHEAAAAEARGEEGSKAHRGVDTHGVHCDREP